MMLFNGETKERKIIKIVLTALLTRYPFWKSISFLLFISDLAHLNSDKAYLVFPNWCVYTITGLYFLCGILCSNSLTRNVLTMSLFCVLQALFSVLIYFHPAVKYSMWIKFKVITYSIGTSGIFLFLASLVAKSSNLFKLYHSISNLALFVYFLFLTFLFLNSNDELNKILSSNQNLISSNLIIKISTIIFSFISMSFFLNSYKTYSSILAIFSILIINCVLLDSKFSEWSKLNISFPSQIASIGDSICIILGLFYIFMFETYKKKLE